MLVMQKIKNLLVKHQIRLTLVRVLKNLQTVAKKLLAKKAKRKLLMIYKMKTSISNKFLKH